MSRLGHNTHRGDSQMCVGFRSPGVRDGEKHTFAGVPLLHPDLGQQSRKVLDQITPLFNRNPDCPSKGKDGAVKTK